MSAAHHTAMVHHAVEEICNRGGLDAADVLFALDYVNHGGLIPDLVRGPEAIKVSVALYRTAFPALQITVEHLSVDEGMAVLHWTAHSTQPGKQVRPPTAGQPGSLRGITYSRFAGGKIAESWTHWDRGRVLRQQGLLPPEADART